ERLLSAEGFALLIARLENVELGVHLADVNLAVRPEGRAFAVPAISEAPDLFTGLGVEAIHAGVLIADVEPAFVDDRRGELDLQAVHLPDQFRLAILDLGGVEADDPAQLGPLGVLLAVADEDQIAVHYRRTVDG